jgi:hypothetical protein
MQAHLRMLPGVTFPMLDGTESVDQTHPETHGRMPELNFQNSPPKSYYESARSMYTEVSLERGKG